VARLLTLVSCALSDLTGDAVGAGDITPDEGHAMASILEAKRKAIETIELESRIAALEKERK
jgi:hypothetical protein